LFKDTPLVNSAGGRGDEVTGEHHWKKEQTGIKSTEKMKTKVGVLGSGVVAQVLGS